MNRIRNLIWGRGRPSRRGERDAQNRTKNRVETKDMHLCYNTL